MAALAYMPVVLLGGARQTGKTTLTKMVAALKHDYSYLSLDHLPTLLTATQDPVGFISQLKKPVIIDEIQRVPELFLPIKADVDEHRTSGRYLLTGSVDPLLLPKLGDSLAGRMRLLQLWPLSQGELIARCETFLTKVWAEHQAFELGKKYPCSKQDIMERALRGGYPTPLAMTTQQRSEWFNDYVSLVLQKDVLDLSRIENITQMPHLLMLLASRVGGLLNVEELARSTRLTSVTLHRYLDLLRTLFMLHVVPAWSSNIGKRLVKSPKVYLIDTALQLFMLGVDYDRLSKDSHLLGSVIENFVVIELLKQLSWHDQPLNIFHYRDQRGSEVDVIIEGPGGKIVAIEIKSTENINQDDFKGLKEVKNALGDAFVQGIVLYAGSTSLPFGDKLIALPIASLWFD